MDVVVSAELFARPLAFSALAALLFLPLEHLFAAHARPRRALAADVAFATVGQVLVRLGLVFVAGWALAALDPLSLDRPPWAAIGDRRLLALTDVFDVAAGLLLFELGGYLYHRLAHRVGWMWRLHEVHHSSETMDWLAAFRQHPLEILLLTLAQNAPLVLLGIPLGAHATVLLLLKLSTIFVHANIRVPAGPWRWVLATPAFHHRHHERGARVVANYASLFPFIDMIFGTHSRETAIAFGLDRKLPATFWGLLLYPLRNRDA